VNAPKEIHSSQGFLFVFFLAAKVFLKAIYLYLIATSFPFFNLIALHPFLLFSGLFIIALEEVALVLLTIL